MTDLTRRAPVAERTGTQRSIRGDIQGLRAVAVLLVLAFHLWPNRLSGGYIGVDVFLVISGFLITSHLLGHPPHDLRGVGSFWARRIRRLLPASLLVLLVTLIASRLVAPETQWSNTAADVRSATLYVLNWRLAENSVDYLAADDAPSAVQHFWSLGVEEQFYAMWPLLILVLGFLAVRRGRDALPVVLAGLTVVVLASFAYGVWMADQNRAVGYFVTPTRIWELGVGALLAGWLMMRDRSGQDAILDGPWRALATVAGLGAIVWAAFTYSGSTPFPGYHATLPVLGAALLIALGPARRPRPLDRVLDNPVAVPIGDISYSIYLWHWPMIVLLPEISGGQLGRLDKAVIILATFVLAALTKTWVEDRFRRPRPARSDRSRPLWPVFATAAAGMAVLVALTLAQDADVSHRQDVARAELREALQGDQTCFGANATAPGADCPTNESGPVVPAPAQAVEDRGEVFERQCRELAPYDGTTSCTFGDPDGDVDVAIAGDSHAMHWVPALDRVGKELGWRVTTYVSAGCPLTEARLGGPEDAAAGCREWVGRVGGRLRDEGFDLVVVSTLTRDTRDPAAEPSWYPAGFRAFLTRLTAGGGPPVAVLQDVPRPSYTPDREVPECVAEHRGDLLACAGPRADWVTPDPMTLAARQMGGDEVTTLDLTDRFCDTSRCPAVIGGVMVYSERSHMTATYAKSLSPFLADRLARLLDGA